MLVTLAVSGVLLWAGLEKLRAGRAFHATLAGLGIPLSVRPGLRYAVPAVEITIAAALLLNPAAEWPDVGVATLGFVFAAAGLLAVRSGRSIECACLGATGHSRPGWRQVYLLPAWLAVAVLLHALAPRWDWQLGLQYLASLLVLLTGIRAVPVIRGWRQATGDRRAIQEAAVALAPIFGGEGGET
jgi:hypothetical protein